jgi:hypothetical protein
MIRPGALLTPTRKDLLMNYGRGKQLVFAAAVTAALGFGATKVFADVAEPTHADPNCDPVACDAYCRSIGAESGGCYKVGCLCLF